MQGAVAGRWDKERFQAGTTVGLSAVRVLTAVNRLMAGIELDDHDLESLEAVHEWLLRAVAFAEKPCEELRLKYLDLRLDDATGLVIEFTRLASISDWDEMLVSLSMVINHQYASSHRLMTLLSRLDQLSKFASAYG